MRCSQCEAKVGRGNPKADFDKGLCGECRNETGEPAWDAPATTKLPPAKPRKRPAKKAPKVEG